MFSKRSIFVLGVIVFSIFFSPFLWAADASKQQAGPPGVLRARLRNGMKVIIVRNTLAPVVAAVMNYGTGSDNNPPGFPGMAHATEHMMFRGSKTLSADQFAEITAITGGAFNGETLSTATKYYYLMPSQDLDIALHLEAARAQDLKCSEELWNEERGAIQQEVTQDYSDADFRLYVLMQAHLLRGTPDADPGLGTVESFDKTTANMLRKFYDAYYNPSNATYVIVGDVDPKATLEKVRKLFEHIPGKSVPKTDFGKIPPAEPSVYKTVSDKPYTLVYASYLFPGYRDKDWAAAQVLSDVLASQRGPLYALVAQGKALASEFDPIFFPADGTAYAGLAVPASMDPQAALDQLKSALDAFKKNGAPPELVEAAKKREIADAEFNRNSILGLAEAWSQAVVVEGRHSPDDDVKAISDVTVADVNAVLRQYIVNETATLGYAVPKPGGPISSEGGGKASESNTVVPKGPVTIPAWATRILSHLGVPRQTLHPAAMHLPNGITLIVQPERETHTVVLSGEILSNSSMQTPEGLMGVASLTESLLPFGTKNYSRLDYQAELDKISASVKAGTHFSLSVLSRYFDRGVELLADDELHPAFSPGDFEIVKGEELSKVKGEQDSPDHLAEVAQAQALYPPGDPARKFATPESVGKLTLDDAKAYHQTVYRPDMAYIVVVGDITPEKAREAVMHYFGEWKAQGEKPDVYPKPSPPNKPAFQLIPAAGRIQDAVTLSQTLSLVRNDKDLAPLTVANAILGEGFYASLLYHDLREVRGYVYYVDSNLDAGKTRSTFSVEYGSMPDKTQKAKGVIVADLKQLQKKPVSLTRLQYAKALLMGRVPLHTQSYNGVARQILYYAVEGLPLDQNIRDASEEIKVNLDGLKAAVKKWLRPDDLVEIVVGPKLR